MSINDIEKLVGNNKKYYLDTDNLTNTMVKIISVKDCVVTFELTESKYAEQIEASLKGKKIELDRVEVSIDEIVNLIEHDNKGY